MMNKEGAASLSFVLSLLRGPMWKDEPRCCWHWQLLFRKAHASRMLIAKLHLLTSSRGCSQLDSGVCCHRPGGKGGLGRPEPHRQDSVRQTVLSLSHLWPCCLLSSCVPYSQQCLKTCFKAMNLRGWQFKHARRWTRIYVSFGQDIC